MIKTLSHYSLKDCQGLLFKFFYDLFRPINNCHKCFVFKKKKKFNAYLQAPSTCHLTRVMRSEERQSSLGVRLLTTDWWWMLFGLAFYRFIFPLLKATRSQDYSSLKVCQGLTVSHLSVREESI